MKSNCNNAIYNEQQSNLSELMHSIEQKLQILNKDDTLNQTEKDVKQLINYELIEGQSNSLNMNESIERNNNNNIKNTNNNNNNISNINHTNKINLENKKTTYNKMFIDELQTSYGKELEQYNYNNQSTISKNNNNNNLNSQYKQNYYLKQSRVLDRINQMQQYYVGVMKQLNQQNNYLEEENYQLNQTNQQLLAENASFKIIVERKERDNEIYLEKQIQQVKEHLKGKFSREMEIQYERYLREIKGLSQQLSQERRERRELQEENKILKREKDQLEQFYHELLNTHRQMLQIDIIKNGQCVKHGVNVIDDISAINVEGSKEKSKVVKKIKNNKYLKQKQLKNNNNNISIKQKLQLSTNNHEINKQQIIPFLKKGIDDLKIKLNVK